MEAKADESRDLQAFLHNFALGPTLAGAAAEGQEVIINFLVDQVLSTSLDHMGSHFLSRAISDNIFEVIGAAVSYAENKSKWKIAEMLLNYLENSYQLKAIEKFPRLLAKNRIVALPFVDVPSTSASNDQKFEEVFTKGAFMEIFKEDMELAKDMEIDS